MENRFDEYGNPRKIKFTGVGKPLKPNIPTLKEMKDRLGVFSVQKQNKSYLCEHNGLKTRGKTELEAIRLMYVIQGFTYKYKELGWQLNRGAFKL